MKNGIVPIASVLALVFLAGCATPGKVVQDFLYVPDFDVESGAGALGSAAYDPANRTFTGIGESSTVAFYSGQKDGVLKRVSSDAGIEAVSASKQAIERFSPNVEDIMVIKSNFTPGYDIEMWMPSAWSEYAYPNRYDQGLQVNIEDSKGEFIESEYLLAVVNRGNKPVKDVFVVDVLAKPVEFLSARYSTEDLFLPLNVNLASVQSIEHKLVVQGGQRALVFHIVPKAAGLMPGDMVQILVKSRVDKNELMKPEYRVKD